LVQIPKSADAQVPHVKWCSGTLTLSMHVFLY
jgi:hypothetical protein